MTGRGRIYRLDPMLPVGGEVRRVATGRLDQAVTHLRAQPAPSTRDRHAAAEAIDDVRALLRLVRGGLDGPARRSATRRLRSASQLVNADRRPLVTEAFELAAMSAADSVTGSALARLRRSLTQQSMLQATLQALADDLGTGPSQVDDPMAADPFGRAAARWSINPWVSVADDLDAAILGASLWVVEADGFEPLADGFEREYRRGREALLDVADDLAPEAHRVLANRVRDHCHHLTLLRPLWPAVLKPMAKEAKRLLDLVDLQHDLGLLRTSLLSRDDPQLRRDARALVGVLDEDRTEVADHIRGLGARLYADEPAVAVARMAGWWQAAARP